MALTRTTSPRPLVSVVVPAYQVEHYLAESLDSILRQSWRNLEVIVVDDGSTDGTGEIADRVAAHDPRVRVVHQHNAGLGAARNRGASLATGDYLAFADSDDLVLPGAYAAMVSRLEQTGSDLVTGAVRRFREDRADQEFVTPLMRENHAHARSSVDVDEHPLLLADCFAWNKLFRRSFWRGAHLSFPVGVRYEDQPTITRALVAARRLDAIPDPVYLWRQRTDGSSISQQRHDPADLADRFLTKRWSTADVQRRLSPVSQRVWFARVLPIDLWEYFRSVPGASDEYWSLLRSGLAEFWNHRTVPFEQTALPLRQRLMGWLVDQDRRADLEDLLRFVDDHDGRLPRQRVAGRVVVDHPFTGAPGLPRELVAG